MNQQCVMRQGVQTRGGVTINGGCTRVYHDCVPVGHVLMVGHVLKGSTARG